MDLLEQLGDTFLNWEEMAKVIPSLLMVGLPNTLILAVASGILGSLLGLLLALMGISRNPAARWAARIYTDLFRGLPAILVILVIGIGLSPIARELTGSRNPYPLGILALTLIAGAYIGEIFRSGIQSVEKGQLEASRALGFSYGSSMRLVVVPQGIRRVLAGAGEPVHLAAEGFLAGVHAGAGVLGPRDLPDRKRCHGQHRQPVAAGGGGLLYLILTVPLTHFVNFIDNRLRTGRPEKKEPDELAAPIGKGAQA